MIAGLPREEKQQFFPVFSLKLNGEKSNLMVICKSDKKCEENHCILLFNDVIRPVSKAKFLGVEINENLNFKEHVQNLTLRAEKRLNMLKILAWGGTDSKILIRLYKTYCSIDDF